MTRLVNVFGGALLLFASCLVIGELNAQPTGSRNRGQDGIARARQRTIDSVRAELRRYEINGRSFATQRNCVRLTEVLVELERIATQDSRDVLLIPESTLEEFKTEARGLHSSLSKLYASLTGGPCPPNAAPPEQAGQGVHTGLNVTPLRPQLRVEGGVSSIRNIEVGNGNFNTELDATGAQFDGTLSVPLPPNFLGANSFQARFYGFNGRDSQALSGNAGTFLQANGQNQAINLNITGGETNTEISQWGGEALFLYLQWLRFVSFSVSPLFGVGFEHITFDTETSVRIAGLDFHASDMRTVKTNTASIIVGVVIENPVLPLPDRGGAAGSLTTFVELRGNANFNRTNATAIYDTAQAGVFSEVLRNEFSRDTVTVGGRIGGGVAYTAPNGARLALKAAVASVPVHELRFHAGQMATIEPRNLLNLSVGGSLTIPFGDGSRPFRGVAPIRDFLQGQERLYRG